MYLRTASVNCAERASCGRQKYWPTRGPVVPPIASIVLKMPSAAPSMYAAHALRDATSVFVHSLLRSPPVNAAADNGTANALAKIKARSMVFLSRSFIRRSVAASRGRAHERRAKVVILHCFTGPQQAAAAI